VAFSAGGDGGRRSPEHSRAIRTLLLRASSVTPRVRVLINADRSTTSVVQKNANGFQKTAIVCSLITKLKSFRLVGRVSHSRQNRRRAACWPSCSTEGQHALVLGPDLGERRPSRLVATAEEERLSIWRRNSIDDWFRLSECHRDVLSLTIQIGRKRSPYNSEDKEVVTYQLGGEPKCGLSQRRLS
jgi:hypothetical protein